MLNCLYYEPERFLAATASPPQYDRSSGLLAGMVPHHLLASDMIAGFFNIAAKGDFERVVIVAPSHYPEECGQDVVTALADWVTPTGTVRCDREATGQLLSNKFVSAEDNPPALEKDHGVAGLIPFVKHYLPNAKVMVCLLSNRLTEERRAEASRLLRELCANGKTLLVASVDCSHYLGPEEAAAMDEITAAAIESFDLKTVMTFGDSNIDSPQTVSVLLELAADQQLTIKRLDHSSSAEKQPQAYSHPQIGRAHV